MNESPFISSLWLGFNCQPWQSISRDFALADRTLSTRPGQAWQKMLNIPSMTPHNLRTARRKAEVQLRTDNGWDKNIFSLRVPALLAGYMGSHF